MIPCLPAYNQAFIDALEACADGVVVCDASSEISYCTPALAPLLSGAESDGFADLQGVLASAVKGQRTEKLNDRSESVLHSVRVIGIPIAGDDGTSLGGVAVLMDNSNSGLSDKVLSDFVANVSHELKTPIAALGLLAETLQMESDPDTAERLIQRLQMESIRVSQVVDDLLNLSRIEGHSVEPPQLLPVDGILTAAIGRVNYAAEHRNVEITVNGAISATLYGYRNDLISALQHLLENGIKYSNPGTTIEVDVKTQDGWTSIAVTDHGMGIAPQYLDRIFERFYRVDDARTRSSGGTGLGLSLVKHVARSHGGNVTVTSEEHVGSTFVLRLAAEPSTATIDNAVVNDDGND